MTKVLRKKFELTPQERAEWDTDNPSITFALYPETGKIVISEQWEGMDELWADGVAISIPPRIWREGIEWLKLSNLESNPV